MPDQSRRAGPPRSASLPGTLLFTAKAFALRRLRTLNDLRSGRLRRHRSGYDLAGLPTASTIRTALWSDQEDGPNGRALTAGKIQNLRNAIRHIDGVEVPAGAIFSFWAQVGRPTHWRGYVKGRELREGCLVANIGGGLCQLSNTLYAAAVDAGIEIVERHAHSVVVPHSQAAAGRDATVFWNYIDLRLRSALPFRIEAHLTGQELVLILRGGAGIANRPGDLPAPQGLASDCTRCGQTDCRRHHPEPAVDAGAARAWLIEAPHPEFAALFAAEASGADQLFLPTRLGPRGARWPGDLCPELTADVEAFRRRLSVRRATSGAALQSALLQSDARLAQIYGRRLSHLHTDLIVSQALLPHLWRDGLLQGRRCDVLIDRLPYELLHRTLDEALGHHSGSATLGEFRAPSDLVEAESAALAAARRLLTAHAALAQIDPARTELLDWQAVPPLAARRGGRMMLLPASPLARKGIHALRDALRGLDAELLIRGTAIEEPEFWHGCRVRMLGREEPLPPIAAVVLPALVEHRPDALLGALAANIPVIATDACGLMPQPGLTLVARDDANALRGALRTTLASAEEPAS